MFMLSLKWMCGKNAAAKFLMTDLCINVAPTKNAKGNKVPVQIYG